VLAAPGMLNVESIRGEVWVATNVARASVGMVRRVRRGGEGGESAGLPKAP